MQVIQLLVSFLLLNSASALFQKKNAKGELAPGLVKAHCAKTNRKGCKTKESIIEKKKNFTNIKVESVASAALDCSDLFDHPKFWDIEISEFEVVKAKRETFTVGFEGHVTWCGTFSSSGLACVTWLQIDGQAVCDSSAFNLHVVKEQEGIRIREFTSDSKPKFEISPDFVDDSDNDGNNVIVYETYTTLPLNEDAPHSETHQEIDLTFSKGDDKVVLYRRDTADIYIDIMVVWPQWYEDYTGGNAQAVAAASNAFAQLDIATKNSGLSNIKFRVVYAGKVGYDVTGDYSHDLSQLRTNTSKLMADGVTTVHDMRTKVGADLVTILSNGGQYCGLAGVQDAWSVILPGCFGGYTHIHEIGHNLGLLHNRENNAGAGLWVDVGYNYGWRSCGAAGSLRSILSYACDQSARVPVFSGPESIWNGVVMGDSTTDNVRMLREQALKTSNYRAAVQPVPVVSSTRAITTTTMVSTTQAPTFTPTPTPVPSVSVAPTSTVTVTSNIPIATSTSISTSSTNVPVVTSTYVPTTTPISIPTTTSENLATPTEKVRGPKGNGGGKGKSSNDEESTPVDQVHPKDRPKKNGK